MRKIRNAAIASAAATSVIFGGMTAATAVDPESAFGVPKECIVELNADEDQTGVTDEAGDLENNGRKVIKFLDKSYLIYWDKEVVTTLRHKKTGEVVTKDGVPVVGKTTCGEAHMAFAIKNHNDPNRESEDPLTTVKKTLKSKTSSPIGTALNADVPVTGKDLLGKHVNSSKQPAWSQLWVAAAALGVIGTVIGIGILPVLNQLRAQGVIL